MNSRVEPRNWGTKILNEKVRLKMRMGERSGEKLEFQIAFVHTPKKVLIPKVSLKTNFYHF